MFRESLHPYFIRSTSSINMFSILSHCYRTIIPQLCENVKCLCNLFLFLLFCFLLAYTLLYHTIPVCQEGPRGGACGGGCLDLTIDLSHSSSHVPHHRPSLWYIGLLIAVLMGLFCGGGCSYCGVDVQGRSTEK